MVVVVEDEHVVLPSIEPFDAVVELLEGVQCGLVKLGPTWESSWSRAR